MGHSHEADPALLRPVHTAHPRLRMEAGDVNVFLCRGHGVLQAGVFGGGLQGGGGTKVESEDASAGVYFYSLPFLSRLSNCAQNSPVVWAYD